MKFEDLSPEMRKKVGACQTPEDVLALAKDAGYELTDDELGQIFGGSWGGPSNNCPRCGSTSYHTIHTGTVDQQRVCNDCGCVWG